MTKAIHIAGMFRRGKDDKTPVTTSPYSRPRYAPATTASLTPSTATTSVMTRGRSIASASVTASGSASSLTTPEATPGATPSDTPELTRKGLSKGVKKSGAKGKSKATKAKGKAPLVPPAAEQAPQHEGSENIEHAGEKRKQHPVSFEEDKQIGLLFRKAGMVFEDVNHSLGRVAKAWEAFEESGSKDSLHGPLRHGLDDCHNSLFRLHEIRESLLEHSELEEEDYRLQNLVADIFKVRQTFEDLRDKVTMAMEARQEELASVHSAAHTLPVYYPPYDPKKDGITFSGTNSRDYATFRIGWLIVEEEFKKRGKPSIELFRQLKRCLSNDPLDLVKDIAESPDAIKSAFSYLDENYYQPLEGMMATIEAISSGGKGSCKGSREEVWNVYKRYLYAERAAKLFNLTMEQENAILLLSHAHITFSASMETKFKRFLLDNCVDADSPLQYEITRTTMTKFLKYTLDTAPRSSGEDKRRPESPSPSLSGKGDKKSGKFSLSSVFSARGKEKCAICGNSGHSAPTCRQLDKKSPEWVLKCTRKEKLCQGCFQPYSKDHRCSVACSRQGCGQRHLTRLHDVVVEHEKLSKSGFRSSGSDISTSSQGRSPGGFGSRFQFKKPAPPGDKSGRGSDASQK